MGLRDNGDMTPQPASVPHILLNDGVSIPQLGLGVYKVPDDQACDVVLTALDAGYRHIDTAAFYENERGVGEAVRRIGLPRDEIFVTTKLWWTDNGYDSAMRAVDASLERLGMDTVDLFLIHWPAPQSDRYVDTWRALERVREEGKARSIGVSNFHVHHLERLARETDTVPALNQVELHPRLQQNALRSYHDEHGIATEAWSPLARGHFLGDPPLVRIAARYGVTAAQVVIRWHLQRGTIVIPKSVTPERIRENMSVFEFQLDDEDMAAIATLETGERTGTDPDNLG